MDFTQADIESLAEKLAAADLTEGEQAVIDALVDAAEGDVAGFGEVTGEFWFAQLQSGTYARFDQGLLHDTAKRAILGGWGEDL